MLQHNSFVFAQRQWSIKPLSLYSLSVFLFLNAGRDQTMGVQTMCLVFKKSNNNVLCIDKSAQYNGEVQDCEYLTPP